MIQPELKTKILDLEAEVRALERSLGPRVPEAMPELEREHQALTVQLDALETSLLTLLTSALKPWQPDEAWQQAEVLRLATVEYCQLSQTDPELWKNIAF